MPPDQNVVRELVLAELRCAQLRAKTAQIEIEFIGTALKHGFISPKDALLGLEGQGWHGFLDPILVSKLRAACVDAG
jgi:hypothetical protein